MLIVRLPIRVFVAFIASASIAVGASETDTSVRIARIERGLEEATVSQRTSGMTLVSRMSYYGIPGVSMAVIHEGRIDWSKAWGFRDAETHLPVTPETLFQAGSISKVIAALTALRLAEDGRLKTDGDVNNSLVDWKLKIIDGVRGGPVTLEQLLSHTSGIGSYDTRGYTEGSAIPTLTEILDGKPPATSPPIRVESEPGKAWVYSNSGYVVLQKLIEDAAQKPYAQVATEEVLGALNLRNSVIGLEPEGKLAENRASAHVSGRPLTGKFHRYPELAVAGLWSTPTDIARIVIDIQKAEAGLPSLILTPAMAHRMLMRQPGGWGLGVGPVGNGPTRRFAHTGIAEGFEAIMYAYCERGEGLVIMTNGVGGQQLINELVRAVANEYHWQELEPRRIMEVDLPDVRRIGFANCYEDEGERVWVRLQNDHLEGRFGGRGWTPLIAITPTRFAAAGDLVDLDFLDEPGGRTLTLYGAGSSRVYREAGDLLEKFGRSRVFVRGTMNEWGLSSEMIRTAHGHLSANLALNKGDYEFKLATADWEGIAIGSYPDNVCVNDSGQTSVAPDGGNLWIQVSRRGIYHFDLDTTDSMEPRLAVAIVNSLP